MTKHMKKTAFKTSLQDATIKKDENGYYLISSTIPDKLYIEELLEEYEDQSVNLILEPPEPRKSSLFFGEKAPLGDAADTAKDAMEVLNIRVKHTPIEDRLNVLTWLTDEFERDGRRLRFRPELAAAMKSNPSKFTTWQHDVQTKVKEVLGFPYQSAPLKPEWGESREIKGIKLTKIYFQSQPGLWVAGVLAHPAGLTTKRPAVVCVHGHNHGKVCTLGFDFSSSHSYYGFELAQQGFVTLSIDQWGWGERTGVYRGNRRENAEAMYSLSALLLGMTAVGIRVFDVSRCYDLLSTLDIVDSENFGVIGQSGGGTTSAFTAALEPRVKAAVISGYYCSLTDSIFSLSHCACNYIPNLLRWADLPEIVGARAPKPTFIVSGERDGIFPQHGVQTAYRELSEIYKAIGAEANLEIDVWADHGHEFTRRRSYPWLARHLQLEQ
jgi:dienelactone hydrolase